MRNRFEEIEEEVRREPDEEPFVRGHGEEETEEEIIDPFYEAAVNHPRLLEEGLAAAQQAQKYWSENAVIELPERVRPLLGFKAFDDVVLAAEGAVEEPAVMGKQGFAQFVKLAEKEARAEEDSYLPTLGSEVEIPHSLPIRGKRLDLFRATEHFIPKTGTADEEWEFAVPYTYSADTQNAYLHELIRGGYIETEEAQGKKRIAHGGHGTFSLHLNIGIPPEVYEAVEPSFKRGLQRNPFYADAVIYTHAFTSAFSSPERIEGRAYTNPVYWGASADASKEKRKKNDQGAPEYDPALQDVPSGMTRLEVRSLEVRDETLYRMLHEAQTIAAALFAAHRPERDGSEEILKETWERFYADVIRVAKKHEIPPFALEQDQAEIVARAVRRTDFQKEMRSLITSFSQEIETVLDEARKKRETENEVV